MYISSNPDCNGFLNFFLTSIEPGEELEVISALRSELDLSPAPAAAMTQLSQQRKARLRRPSRADPRDIDVIVLVRVTNSLCVFDNGSPIMGQFQRAGTDQNKKVTEIFPLPAFWPVLSARK